MKGRSRTFAFTISTALAVLSLAGCATKQQPTGIGQTTGMNNTSTSTTESSNATNSANSATTNVAATNTTNSTGQATSSFPYIVKQAMQTLPKDVLADAQSPTVLPMPQNGDALSFSTTQSTTPPSSGPAYKAAYTVTLKSSTGKVGSWSVWGFASSSDAQNAYPTLASTKSTSSSTGPGAVLAGNINAQVVQNKDGSTSIVWKQAGWNIQVTESNTEVAPIPIADEVSRYLKNTPMHPAGQSGTIDIETSDGTDNTVDAHVIWQNSAAVNGVEVTGLAVKPVATALAMAGSMANYGQ